MPKIWLMTVVKSILRTLFLIKILYSYKMLKKNILVNIFIKLNWEKVRMTEKKAAVRLKRKQNW